MASDVDLTQFHTMFFEECSEGIEIMESGLLNLEIGEPDPESINNIFRAAHSIKGGAGTFGFSHISDFTHSMETLLDEMRNGNKLVTQETVYVLLESVDCLRSLVNCSKTGEAIDGSVVSDLQKRLSNLFSTSQTEGSIIKEAEVKVSVEMADWHISFYPHENLFYTGNDPFRLIRELQTLGDLTVRANLDKLPDFSVMEPEFCYLGWEMQLKTEATYDQVQDVFAWVEDDCDLNINIGNDRRKKEDRRSSDEESVKFGRRKSDTEGLMGAEATSIRVDINKVDDLVNLVGELIISQSILSRVCRDTGADQDDNLNKGLEQLERNTHDLQDQAMRIRMLPIDFVFQRLPRLVHDLSRTLDKQVELNFSGETTELDKTVLEKIGDPLVHLIRNALDHGIEMPELRRKAGKEEKGIINVSAYHEGGNIIIKISDDGAGLNLYKILEKAKSKNIINEDDELSDTEIQNLIFQPGFTTAAEVSDVSGRGVGMDVVKRNIMDLSGTVEVYSKEGEGSTFTINLPLTLAIVEGQMVDVGQQVYIIPLLSIIESIQLDSKQLNAISGKADLYRYREEYIPVINLHQLFNTGSEGTDLSEGILVVVQSGSQRVGFYVDDVLEQQQVVIKSLEKNYQHVKGIAAATILGDGSVALILDVQGVFQHYCEQEERQSHVA